MKVDTIDRIMPDEGDQASFRTGLQQTMELISGFLPPGSIDQIRSRLQELRGTFEGFDLPEEAEDKVAGLAVGMVDYCLFDTTAAQKERKFST